MAIPTKQYKQLPQQIKAAYGEHCATYGQEPKYAEVRVMWDDGCYYDNAIIKLMCDEDKKDDRIFFYCNGLKDLLDLCDITEGSEFIVVKLYDFYDQI